MHAETQGLAMPSANCMVPRHLTRQGIYSQQDVNALPQPPQLPQHKNVYQCKHSRDYRNEIIRWSFASGRVENGSDCTCSRCNLAHELQTQSSHQAALNALLVVHAIPGT
jgi:hypothetical protein